MYTGSNLFVSEVHKIFSELYITVNKPIFVKK